MLQQPLTSNSNHSRSNKWINPLPLFQKFCSLIEPQNELFVYNLKRVTRTLFLITALASDMLARPPPPRGVALDERANFLERIIN